MGPVSGEEAGRGQERGAATHRGEPRDPGREPVGPVPSLGNAGPGGQRAQWG